MIRREVSVLALSSAMIAGMLANPTLARAEAGEAFGLAPENQIVITGHSEGYRATDSRTATKTDTLLINVPQTIQVITREKLDDQAQHSIADVLRYVPGTTVGQGEGNRDQITLRGQNTTADFFLDGVRDDAQYYRPLYNIERVEILKGPYALIFGRGGGGGIINRVQKTPTSGEVRASAAASISSFGAWNISGDLNLPIGAAAAFRINGEYEALESFRDFVEGERFAINPYFAIDLGKGWKAGLSYEYVHDDRVTDRGIPSLACTAPCTPEPLTGNRDTFFGIPGVNRTGLEAHIIKARLDGKIASNLNWSSTVLYGDYDKYYTNAYANGPASAQTGTVALASYTDPTRRRNLIAQTNLVWDVNLGNITNKILFGLEYGNQDSSNQRRNGVLSSSTLNLAAIVYPTVSFPALNRNTVSQVEFVSAYMQDQLSLGEHIELVIGLRHDRFRITGTDLIPATPRAFARKDNRTSPRFGLIYKPQENASIYASYSESFLPRSGDQFLTLTTTQANLAPEKFTNYEIGAKWDIKPGLNITAALFQLDRSNATTRNPADITQEIVIGKTRTKGAEIALSGRILPGWQISGGYSYQDAKVIGTELVRLPQVPRHQFALWNRYDPSSRLGLGLGIVHQSSQLASIRTSLTALPTQLPAFTRIDAAVFYTVSDALQLQLNVENLLDQTYFADAHNNNNITPGAPINARLTAKMRF